MNAYILPLIYCIIGGYLLGAVPFGLVLTRLAGLGDIRKIGSGNIGATNVLRTGRKDLALITLLLDSGKAAIAALVAFHTLPATQVDVFGLSAVPLNVVCSLVAGIAGVLGHNFPVWLKFKGGKGVAATLGMMFATCWPAGLASGVTWLVIAFVFRYSSLSALVALVLSPVYGFYFAGPAFAAGYGLLAILSLIRHRENIARLAKGEESKINLGKKSAKSQSDTQE